MPKTDERPPLTRDRILRAASDIADSEGLAKLSMRRVAAALGFEVMSLYNHVANKQDMLEGMVGLVASEVEYVETGTWSERLRALSISAHSALLRHSWAVELWTTLWPGPARMRYMETTLELLAEAGLPPALAHTGFHAISSHVFGSAREAVHCKEIEEDIEDLSRQFLSRIPAGEFPRMTAHAHQHIDGAEFDNGFEFVLDLILEGLERRRL